MTDKKVYSFVLLPMLALTLILGLLVMKTPASAAGGAGAPAQAGFMAWNPLHEALATTPRADGLMAVPSAPAAPDACTPDTTPMMSYWPLDETSGTAFTDVVDGNHGACTNCPTPATGKVGGAQTFTAADKDGILITEDLANPLTWASGDSFSFEMWVNFTDTEVCTNNKVFFGRYRAPSTTEATWWVGCTPGGFPTFSLRSLNSLTEEILTDDVAINDGQWHHVVAVRDAGAGLNRLYVDGVEATYKSATYSTDFTSAGPISIGYYPTSLVAGFWFDGSIDEVAVYDKALSSTEVANHYNAGAGQSYCSEPPVAEDDNLETDENTDLGFTADDLLANDYDPDGSEVTIEDIDLASTEGGTITDHLDGTYTYSPLADFNGTDTFTYTISSGSETDTATVFVDVHPVNDPPVADDQTVETDEDEAVDITLTATDQNGDSLTYSVLVEPTHGTLSGTAPDLTYTPVQDYSGADSFTFNANDGSADSNTATVSITVNPVNDAPECQDVSLNTDEDTAGTTAPSCTDVEGDLLTYSVSTPANGTAAVVAGQLEYTPNLNFNGPDSFTYTADDGTAASAPATVTVKVNPVNDAPVADAQSVGVVINEAKDITLTGSDVDGDLLTFAVVDPPLHGTLSGTAPDLTYTPDTDYTGADSITFKVNDGTVDSEIATVDITVSSTLVAVDDELETDEDTPVEFPDSFLFNNDSNPNGGTLTISAIDTVSTEGGTIEDIGSGFYRYTPAPDFNGTDTFEYTVTNGVEEDTATVTVTVNPVDDGGNFFLYLPLIMRSNN